MKLSIRRPRINLLPGPGARQWESTRDQVVVAWMVTVVSVHQKLELTHQITKSLIHPLNFQRPVGRASMSRSRSRGSSGQSVGDWLVICELLCSMMSSLGSLALWFQYPWLDTLLLDPPATLKAPVSFNVLMKGTLGSKMVNMNNTRLSQRVWLHNPARWAKPSCLPAALVWFMFWGCLMQFLQ